MDRRQIKYDEKKETTMDYKKIKNFHLSDHYYLEKELSDLYLYEHEKTKAQVLLMKNEDPNRFFSIGFRTLPIGSTGNCHILEHSVLNGSRKYKTKEPFMDLIKGSLNTFLNAITFPDKTCYPLGSQNKKDFHHLMDAYLDAVFYPDVLTNPLIFRQEGWRYHILDQKDPITYSGVVYNEMKGATSSPEDQVQDHINRYLFPNSSYSVNSGGDPFEIPNLSFEELVEFHQDNYHPSNAHVFLYGDIEEETFSLLDDYFQDFSYKEMINMPEKIRRYEKPLQASSTYSLGLSDDPKNKDYLSLSFLFDEARPGFQAFFYEFFSRALVESPASPLKKAILKEIDCEDFLSSYFDVREVGFSFLIKNAREGQEEKFQNILLEELGEISKKGLDQDLIEACFNDMTFYYKEKGKQRNKGFFFFYEACNEWNYGKSPFLALDFEKSLGELKDRLAEGYLESFIQEYILDNPHRIFLVHKGQAGLNSQKEKDLQKKLEAYKNSLSKEELDQLLKENQKLLERQNRPDTKEEKATIPTLKLEDLESKVPKVKRKIIQNGEVIYLFHDLNTSGIEYLDIYFPVDNIQKEEITYMALVCELLEGVSTKKHDYSSLSNLVHIKTGGIYLNPGVFPSFRDPSKLNSGILLSISFSDGKNIEEGLDLCYEELFESLFDDEDRILELLKEIKSSMESSLIYNGHQYASHRALSHVFSHYNYEEKLKGLEAYMNIKDIMEHFDQDKRNKIEEVYKKLFLSPKKIIHITCPKKDHQMIYEKVKKKLDKFPTKILPSLPYPFLRKQRKEAFYMTTDIQFVGLGQDLGKHNGRLLLLAKILSDDYLYNEIRAKSGAYGAGMSVGNQGSLSLYSYRDPHLRKTIDTYLAIPKEMEEWTYDQDDLLRFIIGQTGNFLSPKTEYGKALLDLFDYISENDEDFYNRTLREIQTTKIEDLLAYKEELQELLPKASLVCIGKQEAIMEEKDLFDQIYKL